MKTYLLLLFFFIGFNSSAQDWLRDIQKGNVNFFVVQKEFNVWKKTHSDTAKKSEQFEDISGQYYCWESYWKTHFGPDGTLIPEPLFDRKQLQKRLRGSNTSNWQQFPYTVTDNIEGIGRIDCIAISPVDSNTLWAGSPTGGLWKSTNDGLSWTTNTDTLPRIGISDIVIDPLNPAVMYLAMGDRDNASGSGVWSIGGYKSTDTGKTWHATGLSWLKTNYSFYDQNIRRLIIDPSNDNILYAATMIDLDSSVVYKTMDAGNTWKEIFGAPISQFDGRVDVALMPGHSSTVYIATINTSGNTQVNTSLNSGSTFTSQVLTSNGTANHVLLATTPANANYVYVLTANQSDYNSLYLSKDGGSTFKLQSDSPNILGYDCSANPGFGNGQGYYDLSLAVSPVNADLVIVGGISVWQSHDAGVTWTLPSNSCNYLGDMHPDQHYTLFSPYSANTIYEGNDGGITKSTDLGDNWTVISSNMRTTQYYGSEASLSEANVVIGGTQDNGTKMIRNDTAIDVEGGDGTRLTYFDNKDDDIISLVITNGFYIIDSSNGNAIAPSKGDFQFNPQNPNAIYCYQGALYKSYDFGSTWYDVHNADSTLQTGFYINFPTDDSDVFLTVMLPSYQLYKVDAKTGVVKNLTGNIPNIFVFNFCGSNTDINKIWVEGSINGTSYIYYTSDGGTTWTDVTRSLAGQGIGTLIYQANSNDAIYAACSEGVAYTDASQSDWVDWSSGLPNIGINEISINYPTNQLVASTFGRGIWETPLYGATSGISHVIANNNSIKLYPNPNDGHLTIQLQKINQDPQLQIFNMLGDEIYTANLNSTTTQLNLSNYTAGIYLYRVIDEQGNPVGNGKFVIE